MPTLHFDTQSEMEKELVRLVEQHWYVYMRWQAADGSWHAIVFESKDGKKPW